MTKATTVFFKQFPDLKTQGQNVRVLINFDDRSKASTTFPHRSDEATKILCLAFKLLEGKPKDYVLKRIAEHENAGAGRTPSEQSV